MVDAHVTRIGQPVSMDPSAFDICAQTLRALFELLRLEAPAGVPPEELHAHSS